jgi:hypothetical protein
MAPPRQATGVSLALIDDDGGLLAVLDRRLEALHHTQFGVGYRFAAEPVGGAVALARWRRGGAGCGRRTLEAMTSTLRNVITILALAAVVAIVPGGGTASSVLLQAVWLVFLAALTWAATIFYRERRTDLYGLGDRRRAALYAALATLVVTLTATHRLWASAGGSIAWLVLVGGAVYVGGAVLWSARRY